MRKLSGDGGRLRDALSVISTVHNQEKHAPPPPKPKKKAAADKAAADKDASKSDKPKRGRTKKTELDKVQERGRQEMIATAAMATDMALGRIVQALLETVSITDESGKVIGKRPKLQFKNAEQAITALARVALAQADLVQLINESPLGLRDTEPIKARLFEAVRKLGIEGGRSPLSDQDAV